jgi:hypothetical protein
MTKGLNQKNQYLMNQILKMFTNVHDFEVCYFQYYEIWLHHMDPYKKCQYLFYQCAKFKIKVEIMSMHFVGNVKSTCLGMHNG